MMLMAFFSGIETGLVSLRKSRVRTGVKQNLLRAKILDYFINHPGDMLATTLIGTNVCVVCSSNSAKVAMESLGFNGTWGIIILTAIMTVLLLFIEIVPKDWFRQEPYFRCMFFSYILYASYIIFYIPVKLTASFTAFISAIIVKQSNSRDSSAVFMREDFKILLRESEDGGVIDHEAADILDRALEFHYTNVADMYIPADQVIDIPFDMSIAEAVKFCRRHGKSRLPVKDLISNTKSLLKWKGVFTVYDALFDIPEDKWETATVSEYMRPLIAVSCDTTINELIQIAKVSETGILVIKDNNNFESDLGILTISDVIKLLFG
jgi:CBS domain containing-hemolysin-like protein